MIDINLRDILNNRILVLDGAMGTEIQKLNLTENDFRGELFDNINVELKGNNDVLVLTQPEIIKNIHREYLIAGADIIETNTFNATRVSMSDYGVEGYIAEINREAVRIAKEAAAEFSTKDKPRFVAGSVGPTNKSCSISPDVNNPSVRAISYDELFVAYSEQIETLMDEGVDIILIETVFDTLNLKCAVDATQQLFKIKGKVLPIMISMTIADNAGRTLSGQTIEAFVASISHAPILSVGINCSFGAREIFPYLKRLAEIAPFYISVHPNAGLPNRFGEYDETPQSMIEALAPFFNESLVNIIGGCCGTTPEHIKLIAKYAENVKPHSVSQCGNELILAGLEPLKVCKENNFINIGERCNVAGSRKFLRLINEKNYSEALSIALKQVEDGAQIIDINMDDGMLDAKCEMVTFLNLLASEPDICRVPFMIDSSDWSVIEAGLKSIQGKAIVNSISLKEGENVFIDRAKRIKEMGAAVVVMAFDENGQADNFERKISVCKRAYEILVNKCDFAPQDIIFDPNILAVATGIDEHRNYGKDFIEATRWIKNNLPNAKVSGGVSNLSFSFRGNNYIREVMHSVFLYHAINASMDMAILNPASSISYNDIPENILTAVEDVILNRDSSATEKLIELAESIKNRVEDNSAVLDNSVTKVSVEERLCNALVKGCSNNLEEDISEALSLYGNAVSVIEGPLMEGMNRVGLLFGEGKMFLPQVVKSARTMKCAVEILQPYIQSQNRGVGKAGKIVLATVKGDVHDIGKNIVSVILSCNNFEVMDLGVMVSAETIIDKAVESDADIIGVSGLITPSLNEMCNIASELERRGLKIPLLIGGATTSELHTAVKIAPLYSGAVIHVKDASQDPIIAAKLMNGSLRETFICEIKEQQEFLRRKSEGEKLVSLSKAESLKDMNSLVDYSPVMPKYPLNDEIVISYSIEDLLDYINWVPFFNVWKLSGKFASVAHIHGCDHCKAAWITSFEESERAAASEAMQLHKECMRLVYDVINELSPKINAVIKFFKAHSENNNIVLESVDNMIIPTLRQQKIKDDNEGGYVALSDFIYQKSDNIDDYIAVFATTVGLEIQNHIEHLRNNNEDFKALVLQSFADRIAEAAAAYTHYLVITKYWGYNENETKNPAKIVKGNVCGIRPAIGYPSLPDQSLIFEIGKVIDFEKLGIAITENGAMYPNASICGLMFANQNSKYFTLAIDDEQREIYARTRGFSKEECDKWLSI